MRRGRVQLELPRIAENGHSVRMTVRVDSPMTEADHVRQIDLIADRNPIPRVATFSLGPECGRAEIESRLRLNGSQRVTAIAQLSLSLRRCLKLLFEPLHVVREHAHAFRRVPAQRERCAVIDVLAVVLDVAVAILALAGFGERPWRAAKPVVGRNEAGMIIATVEHVPDMPGKLAVLAHV